MPAAPPPEPPRRDSFIAVGASLFLWLVACALPAAYVRALSGELSPYYGAACAVYGPYVASLGCFGWFGNLPWVVAEVLLWRRHYRAAAFFSAVAVVIALHTRTLFPAPIALHEGAVDSGQPEHLGPGFVVWMVSLAAPAVISVWLYLRTRARARGE